MQPNEWAIILNPLAGRGAALRAWPVLETALQEAGIHFRYFETAYQGHAIRIARQCVDSGCRRILAVGGDGTIHECVNGLFQQEAIPADEVTIGICPVGTGNDWAAGHGWSRDIRKIVQSMKSMNTCIQDAGECRFEKKGMEVKRFFINVVGLAYDAFVVDYVSHRRPWFLGKVVYLWYAVKCLWAYRVVPSEILLDGTPVKGRFITIHIGMGRSAGGGMKVLPHARAGTGKLFIMAAADLPKWKILMNMWRFYWGDITSVRGVHARSADTVQVRNLAGDIPVEADGEFLGNVPVRISILRGVIRVLDTA